MGSLIGSGEQKDKTICFGMITLIGIAIKKGCQTQLARRLATKFPVHMKPGQGSSDWS